MNVKCIKNLFLVAAAYDFLIGVVFLLGFRQIYSYFNIALPNHDGYIQFAAAIITIFGIGFWFVSKAPERNRDIIKMGILLKIAYCGTVFYHCFLGNIPSVWVPFAWFDLIFLGLFIGALRSLSVLK